MHASLLRRIAAMACMLLATSLHAQADDDMVWRQALRVTGHVDGIRASFTFMCRERLDSAPPRMRVLCGKLQRIPNWVLEDAALPFAKHYLTVRLAEQAVTVWSTRESQELARRVRDDVESGGRGELTSEEVRELRARADTDYGQALLALGKDREALQAVARAMGEYEP